MSSDSDVSETGGSVPELGPASVDCAPESTAGAFCGTDRKSTRLNSSHGYISYAVFCLKKKKNVVSRTTLAVDYRHHSVGTSIDFRGTDLMREARGHARVESRSGWIEVASDIAHLPPSR